LSMPVESSNLEQQLASLMHTLWSDWIAAVMTDVYAMPDSKRRSIMNQMKQSYEELPEVEKAMRMKSAEKVMKVLMEQGLQR